MQSRMKRTFSILLAFLIFVQPVCATMPLAHMKLECVEQTDSIITSNEWEELQLDWLAKKLDCTQTSMGSWAFKKMLHPIADKNKIEERQAYVKALTQDPELYEQIQKCLLSIKHAESFTIEKGKVVDEVTGIETEHKVEGGLLEYWNPAQYKEWDKLFAKVAQLYYSALFVPKKNFLNTHHIPLEVSTALEMARTSFSIVYILGVEGFLEGLARWMFSDKYKFDPLKSFTNGITQPLRLIDPRPTDISKRYNPNTNESWQGSFFEGTLGDIFYAMKYGYNSIKPIHLRGLGRLLHKVPGFKNKIDEHGVLTVTSKAYDPNNESIGRKVGSNAFAGTLAVTYSYMRLGMLYEMLKGTSKYWMVLFKSLKQLQIHLVRIAHGMKAIQKLHQVVNEHEVLRNSCMAHHMNESLNNPSKTLKHLFTVLSTSTFKSKTNGIVFSRGRTLLAHKLLEKSKDALLPVLRAVGELDALCAMACNVKESQNTNKPFCYVTFTQGPEAAISFENAWVPVLDDAVSNDIQFGGSEPTKLVITGPNGGGKSTVLKALGHSVVLAQSWGIVPASRASMTMFNAVRTCLHPHESLQTGLSTFMAEKGRVDEIMAFVEQNRFPGFKLMVLLDEPFKGTVDKESAERIYNFGKQIAELPESIVCIATHVKKPIFLAEDTGVFSNRHVVITQKEDGSYKREFRLADGPAHWWFEDKERRSHFIDWLGEETLKMKHDHKLKVR